MHGAHSTCRRTISARSEKGRVVSSLVGPKMTIVSVPTAGAIGNAVANAIGARVRSLPITPAKVLAALGGA